MLGHWAALYPRPPSSPLEVDALGAWALQFTPRVAVWADCVVAEVSGSLRLFGGAHLLHQRLAQGAQDLGVQVGWAPTATAAVAVVHQHQGPADLAWLPMAPQQALVHLLDPLPLQALPAVAAHRAVLSRLGCRSLGNVRLLPRAGLSRRVGPELLACLDQAYGLQPEVHRWITAAPYFHARLELPSRVESAPALMFAAQRLLGQLVTWLSVRHLGAVAFTLHWGHDSLRARDVGAEGELTVRMAQPGRCVTHFVRLLAEHLAQVTLAAPVADIRLEAHELVPLAQESGALIPQSLHRTDDTDRVLERIQARLGPDSVRRPQLCADHRLEWMQHWHHDLTRSSRGAAPVSELPLPTWVLDEPLKLQERDHRPVYHGSLQLILGPDRIEGGWWHRRVTQGQMQALNVQRDYWVAASPQAGLLWVFQQRLAQDQTAWFLHGFFA